MATVEQVSEQLVSSTNWPHKYDLMGIQVSGTTYEEATDAIADAAKRGASAVVSLTAVHAIVTFSGDPELKEKVNRFELIGPDGQPVRWALNFLYRLGLKDRVCGPEMTLRICERAAAEQLGIFLYGGTPEVIKLLETNLTKMFPGLIISGTYAPPFRPLTDEEDEDIVKQVNDSGAAIVFIGLGCPKQDHFAADHRDRFNAVQVCVGAAFDFHAGVKKMAPVWMQKRGLEWVYRLLQEPRRLWRRYLVTNTLFVMKFIKQWCFGKRSKTKEQTPAAAAAN